MMEKLHQVKSTWDFTWEKYCSCSVSQSVMLEQHMALKVKLFSAKGEIEKKSTAKPSIDSFVRT
jgi:hypothetical protein